MAECKEMEEEVKLESIRKRVETHRKRQGDGGPVAHYVCICACVCAQMWLSLELSLIF